MTYTFHHDPGHGWLEVTKAELGELGLTEKVSSFSYFDGDKVFLEEDYDAPLFITVWENAHGETISINSAYTERFYLRGNTWLHI